MNRKDLRIGRRTFYRCITCFLAIVCLFSSLLLYSYSAARRFAEKDGEESARLLSIQLCSNIASTLRSVEQITLSAGAVSSRYASLFIRCGEGVTPDVFQRMTAALDEHLSEKPYISFVMAEEEKGRHLFFRTRKTTDVWLIRQQIIDAIEANRASVWQPGGRAVWTACQLGDRVLLIRSVFDDNTLTFVGTVAVGLECSLFDPLFASVSGASSGSFALLDAHLQPIYATAPTEGAFTCGDSGVAAAEGWKTECYDVPVSGLQLVHYINIRQQNKRYNVLMTQSVVLMLISMVLVFLFFRMTYFRTVNSSIQILQQIDRIAHGQFQPSQAQNLRDSDMAQISRCLDDMASQVSTLVENIRLKEEALSQSERLLMQTKYDLLRSQVNPHFLYNALETIHSMAILHNEKDIGEMVCRLGAYFRASLMSQSDLCTIEQEMAVLKNYISLYEAIYPQRLRVQYDIDPACLAVQVPSLLFQPIVENALVHGMENKVGQCLIRIEVHPQGDAIRVCIEDDGNGISAQRMRQLMQEEASPSGRVGLLNVRRRLRLVYGEASQLSIVSEEGQYTRVTVIFATEPPAHTGGQDVYLRHSG